ncbi:MAG TPA: hypothetical protein VIC71_12780 [Gammaproteobacteria bacterium]
MLKFLKRWLGWEEDLEYFDPDDFKPVPRPRSAIAQVLAGKPRKPPTSPRMPRPAQAPADAEPLEADFNPYNTGKFDRSASWERIGKNSR